MRTSGQTAGATVSDLTKKTKQKTVGKRRKRERERERENAVEKIFLSKMKNDEPIGFSVARAVSSHLPRFHILKKKENETAARRYPIRVARPRPARRTRPIRSDAARPHSKTPLFFFLFVWFSTNTGPAAGLRNRSPPPPTTTTTTTKKNSHNGSVETKKKKKSGSR